MSDEIEHAKSRINHWKSEIEKWKAKLKEVNISDETGTSLTSAIKSGLEMKINDAKDNILEHQKHLAMLDPDGLSL